MNSKSASKNKSLPNDGEDDVPLLSSNAKSSIQDKRTYVKKNWLSEWLS